MSIFKRVYISEADAERIVDLFAGGMSIEDIAKQIGCSVSTAYRLTREHRAATIAPHLRHRRRGSIIRRAQMHGLGRG